MFLFNSIATKIIFINSCLIFKSGNSEYKILVWNLLFVFKINFAMAAWLQAFPVHEGKPLPTPKYNTEKLTAVIQGQYLSELCKRFQQFPQSLFEIFHMWQRAEFIIYYNYLICVVFSVEHDTSTKMTSSDCILWSFTCLLHVLLCVVCM